MQSFFFFVPLLCPKGKRFLLRRIFSACLPIKHETTIKNCHRRFCIPCGDVVGVSLKDLEKSSHTNGFQAVSKRFYLKYSGAELLLG